MEERITRDECNMQIAYTISKRSTCGRLHVGCVITKEGRIISTGYNGPPRGENSCICDLSKPCERAVHAEVNAIYAAAKEGISVKGATLYTTHSPCMKCTEAIIQSGISSVIYAEEFRDDRPLNKLTSHCIYPKKHVI